MWAISFLCFAVCFGVAVYGYLAEIGGHVWWLIASMICFSSAKKSESEKKKESPGALSDKQIQEIQEKWGPKPKTWYCPYCRGQSESLIKCTRCNAVLAIDLSEKLYGKKQ